MSEDYTYHRVLTMKERFEAAQAQLQQDLASVDCETFTQRTTARLAELQSQIDQHKERDKEIYGTLGKLEAAVDVLTLQVHRLSERQDHADAWLHKLLNPDDNPPITVHTVWTGTASAGQFSGDHEDGL